MTSVSVHVDIAATPDAVFDRITDIPNAASFIQGIEKMEPLTDGPVAPGWRWRETRIMMGKASTEEMQIATMDKPKGYTVTAASHGAEYLSVFNIEPIDSNHSRLTMTFHAKAVSTFAKVMYFVTSWMIKGSMAKMCQKDLEDIKRSLES